MMTGNLFRLTGLACCEDVALAQDEELFALDLDLGAAVFGENDAVANLELRRETLAVLQHSPWADGDDLALLWLLFGRIGQHDPAPGLLLAGEDFDYDPVSKRLDQFRSPFHLIIGADPRLAFSTRGP